MIRAPFQPRYGAGQVVAPAAASANITIDANKYNKNVCLTNLGAAVCYVRVGKGAQVATVADYPVPPNAQVVISKDQDDDSLAHISATGTSLQVLPGDGW
jgi:hypothetical protein